MRAQLLFVIDSASFFSQYLTYFQSEDTMIHNLYDRQQDMLLKLKGKVFDLSVADDPVDTLPLLPVTEIQYSTAVEKELKKMKDGEVKKFKYATRKHYQQSFKYLEEKLCLDKFNLLSDLRALKPEEFKVKGSESRIIALANALPFEVDTCRLADEWKLLKFQEIEVCPLKFPIDKHWAKILSMKDSNNQTKFPTLSTVVKGMLSLSHGSSAVERAFSASSNVLTPDKASMNERGLNARLNVKSGLKKYDGKPFLVPITKELLLLGANAHQSYENYLNDRKKIEEQKKEDDVKKMQLKLGHESAMEIKKLSLDLMEKKNEGDKKRKASDQLLKEATKRLDEAIKKNDMQEVLAQGMLHGVKKMRSCEKANANEVTSIVNDIGKKSVSITSYFKKQQK